MNNSLLTNLMPVDLWSSDLMYLEIILLTLLWHMDMQHMIMSYAT